AVFPPQEQEMVSVRLSETPLAIISQRLLPRKGGDGRVLAGENMIALSTIRDAILDPERTHESFAPMAQGREQYGSQTFDQHLMDMLAEGVVEYETAKAAATNPSDFELKVKTLA